MSYRDCSTCAYSEMHEYLDTFYCRNRDCVMHTSHDFQEICGCENWESKGNFKWGRCSECRFGEYNAEEDKFVCHSKDTRQFIHDISRTLSEDCPFCSPKPKEASQSETQQKTSEKTTVFTQQTQPVIRLYSVRYRVEDDKRLVRIEYLVNATSLAEADTLARTYFAETSYKDEQIVGDAEVELIAEKGIISSSKLYLGSK